MKLQPIITQIRTYCPSFGERVAGAAEYAAAKASTALPTPLCFVIPLDDNPERNGSQNGLRQTLLDSFGVVVALSNEPDEKGQSSADRVDDIRTELWAALLNWAPADIYDGIEYQAGTLLNLDRGRLWWQFEFGATTEIDATDGFQPDRPHFEGVTVRVDQINPAADRNIKYPGPDGRIETEMRINGLPT